MSLILDDFLVLNAQGLYCRYGDFYLDPQCPVHLSVISHAHGDHASPGSKLVHCTEPTAVIMQHRYGKRSAQDFKIFGYHNPFFIQDIKITFVSAGHILGSAQVLMEYQGIRYLYSGDYKLQADATCERIFFVTADVLITESTFANPKTKHPADKAEIQKLNETPHNILLGAYALGKAQRINALINEYCPDRKVLVHHAILPIHRIYESFGVDHMVYQPYDRKIMKHQLEGFIYLVPPLTFNSYFRAKNLLKAFASGWERLQNLNDISLYISDHVDWEDILLTIREVNPSEIWTLHGDGHYLKEYFQDKIRVKILN